MICTTSTGSSGSQEKHQNSVFRSLSGSAVHR